jgi:hypothetical protein
MGRLKRGPPLGLLVAALIVVLGTFGVVQGLWSETLEINGQVETGEVDADWTASGCFEFHNWPQLPPAAPLGEYLGKDVGSFTVDGVFTNDLTITIDGAYPSYAFDCEVHYTNTGTVPWHVESITFTPIAGLTGCSQIVKTPPGSTTGNFTANCDQLTVRWVDGLCTQVHPAPDDDDTVATSLIVHVEQPAPENSLLQFTISIQVNQWNESNC